MGKYPTYPEYQDALADWLGRVPSNWSVARLGQYFEERREKVSDKDFAPLSVTMRGVVPQLDTAAKTDAGDNRKMVRPGDFVINSRSDRKGSSGVSELEGSVSLISIVLKPRDIEPAFVHHLLRSQPFQEEFYRYGKGIVADLWSTNYSEMKNILLPIPTLDEQRAIAAFLDHETAKIDRLIAKQERLIELLKEKRQAVISHAVTKGLNPDAPMKDSGVEWLGEVPAHWKVSRLKYETTHIVDCLHSTPHYTEEGDYPAIRTADISPGRLNLLEAKRVTYEEYRERIIRLEPRPDDIVYSREGERFGMAAIVPERGKLCLGQRVMMFRASSGVEPAFLMWSLNSTSTYRQAQQDVIGATSPHVNVETIQNFWLAYPPLDEQVVICQWITSTVGKIDLLVQKAEHSIDLMSEHRAALISAAVTGKVDIRDWRTESAEYETALSMAAEEFAEYSTTGAKT